MAGDLAGAEQPIARFKKGTNELFSIFLVVCGSNIFIESASHYNEDVASAGLQLIW